MSRARRSGQLVAPPPLQQSLPFTAYRDPNELLSIDLSGTSTYTQATSPNRWDRLHCALPLTSARSAVNQKQLGTGSSNALIPQLPRGEQRYFKSSNKQ